MKKLTLAFLLIGCGPVPESFHRNPDFVECPDDGTDWYFSHCPDGEGTLCFNERSEVRASSCVHDNFGVLYTCVAVCQ
jgi:hypothetical protein